MVDPTGPDAMANAMWQIVKLGFLACTAMGLFVTAVALGEYGIKRLAAGADDDHLP
jgi:hypothetical protein